MTYRAFEKKPAGPTYFEFSDDFQDEYTLTAAASPWVGTALSSGTGTQADGLGGILSLANAASTDNSGYQVQSDVESFILTAGKEIEMECRFRILDGDNSDIFIGLATTDTTLLGATGLTASNDIIGLLVEDGTATLKGVAYTASAAVGTCSITSITDSQWYHVYMRVIPDSTTATTITVQYQLDGGPIRQFSCTGASAQELCPSIAYVSGTTVTAGVDVDYIAIRQVR